MAKYLITDSLLNDLADAVSAATGEATPLTIEDMTDVMEGITPRDSTDLSASGATVTVPAGLYAAQATKSVASGTAGTPTATKGTVSNHSVNVTPSVTNTTGYITGSTKTGTAVSVSASELVSGTLNVTSSGTKDVTNYASASIPAGSATPSATKGAVSNHSVTVTPSVTTTAGFVTAGSTTGTAVSVSASELDSGTKSITANGTGIDVVGYAAVDVAVPIPTQQFTVTISGSGNSSAGYAQYNNTKYYTNGDSFTVDENDTVKIFINYGDSNYLYVDGVQVASGVVNYNYTVTSNIDIQFSLSRGTSSGSITEVSDIQPLSVNTNGTYTASGSTRGYSPVTVAVPGGQPTLQTKSKTYTPTTSQQTESITPDQGYDGLGQVNVTVNAMTAMTLPWQASSTGTGVTVTSFWPEEYIRYINIPTGYNDTAQNYCLREMSLGTLSATANGTYNASTDPQGIDGYKTVTVNVSGGGGTGKNAQVVQQNSTRITATTYTKACGDITVSKTGTYDVYWTSYRTSTSGTWGTQLYIGGEEYGSAQTTFSNSYFQAIHLSNVSLTANQTVAVYGRSRGNGYYLYVGQLTIIEA